MTIANTISLFIALTILAVIPGPGVFTIVARSMASGFYYGLAVVLGIICGDYVFILLSVYGLSTLANTHSGLFAAIQYAGAAYLFWLGVKLLVAKPNYQEVKSEAELSFFSNYLTGLIVTLGNPKAILFYFSLLPAFVDLQKISLAEVGLILVLAGTAVGGVAVVYAYLASAAGQFFTSEKAFKTINVVAGIIMIGTGIVLALRA